MPLPPPFLSPPEAAAEEVLPSSPCAVCSDLELLAEVVPEAVFEGNADWLIVQPESQASASLAAASN